MGGGAPKVSRVVCLGGGSRQLPWPLANGARGLSARRVQSQPSTNGWLLVVFGCCLIVAAVLPKYATALPRPAHPLNPQVSGCRAWERP